MRRETKAYPGTQTGEQAIRIEEFEPEIEWVAANPPPPTGPLLLRSVPRVEEPGVLQSGDEGMQGGGGKGRREPLFGSVANHLDGGLAVELLSDEVLGLPEAEEVAGQRLLD